MKTLSDLILEAEDQQNGNTQNNDQQNNDQNQQDNKNNL